MLYFRVLSHFFSPKKRPACSISELLRKIIISRERLFLPTLASSQPLDEKCAARSMCISITEKEKGYIGDLSTLFPVAVRRRRTPQASKGGPGEMLTAAAARRGAAAAAAAAWAAPAFHSSAPALSKSTVSPYRVTSSPPCIFTYLI